jgi:hypothetical protein
MGIVWGREMMTMIVGWLVATSDVDVTYRCEFATIS